MAITNTTRFELTQWSSGDDEFSREQVTLDNASIADSAAIFLSGTSATPPTASTVNTKAFYWDKTNSVLYFRGDLAGASPASWTQVHPVLPAGHIHSDLQPLDADLTALAALSTTGIVTRTGTDTYSTRSIAVSGTGLSISNDSGISGNMTISINATSANTASTVVSRDSSGNFTAGTVTAALSGNATTATTLATSRAFSISGDGTAPSISFNGSSTVGLVLTLATVNSTTGTFGDSVTVPVVTVNGKGLVTSVTTSGIRAATTSVTGIVQLTDSTSSTSTTTAATPNSVKTSYDIAAAALARSGGTMTGKIVTVASGTSTASILLGAGSADPTSPTSGDVWNNAGTLKLYNGTATKVIAYTDDVTTLALARSGGTMTGKITTVASSTSTASILLSPGSGDPSAPSSGDLWNNAGTLKLYNGSATKTVAYTDSNVATATALQTSRTFTLTGDVATTNSGSTAVTATFDGTASPSFTIRVKNDSHTHDTQYYTQTQVNNAKIYQYGNITAGGTDTSGAQLPSSGTRTTPRIYVQSNDPSAATGYVGVTGDIWFQI